ncbi:MAG: hypothetical protein ACKVIW_07735 [bacterium]
MTKRHGTGKAGLPPMLRRPFLADRNPVVFRLDEDCPILLPAGSDAVGPPLYREALSLGRQLAGRTGFAVPIERRSSSLSA